MDGDDDDDDDEVVDDDDDTESVVSSFPAMSNSRIDAPSSFDTNGPSGGSNRVVGVTVVVLPRTGYSCDQYLVGTVASLSFV